MLAVDQSLSRCGWCLLETGVPGLVRLTVGHYRPPGEGVERLAVVRSWYRDLLTKHEPDLAVLEDYALSMRTSTGGTVLHKLGELGGVLKLTAHERGYALLTPRPNQVKKWATGSGATRGKEPVVEAAQGILASFPHEGEILNGHDDKADALFLALIGFAYLCPPDAWQDSLTAPQREVLTELRGGVPKRPRAARKSTPRKET